MGSLFFIILIISVLLIPIHFYLNKRGKGKNFLFYSGLIYVLIGLPILPSFLIYLGIGSCTIGILFLILSNKNFPIPLQVFLSLAPIVLFAGISFYSESSNNIFLIPNGYTGRIVIIHSCKNGAEKEYESMSRIYKIPQSGILKTKFSFAGNSFDHLHSKYFYIDSVGNRTEILEDTSKIHPHGLWTLSYNKQGDTIIDFILDNRQADPSNYQVEKNELYQSEIDSCLDN
ncbi:MAG: hypothetical protein IPL26_23220 [Leptospiraceae bacterium]|nr:hypothetical protein [Leptospiraceae bacterium]